MVEYVLHVQGHRFLPAPHMYTHTHTCAFIHTDMFIYVHLYMYVDVRTHTIKQNQNETPFLAQICKAFGTFQKAYICI